MTAHHDRVQRLASEASSHLGRDPARDILLPADGCPQWFTDLCHAAHAGMMPDDGRHEPIRDALGAIGDGADEDRLDLGGLYPYTADRPGWLASHLDRPGYCDGAAGDYGQPFAETPPFIAAGVQRELEEVYQLVRGRLEEQSEAQADDEAEKE